MVNMGFAPSSSGPDFYRATLSRVSGLKEVATRAFSSGMALFVSDDPKIVRRLAYVNS
jgi:hypothetical protein